MARVWVENEYSSRSIGVPPTGDPVAAFDLDSTLISKFKKDTANKEYSLDVIFRTLGRCNLLIVSNRADSSKVDPVIDFVNELDKRYDAVSPISAIAAYGGRDRKPFTGAIEWYRRVGGTNSGFYCGDADGMTNSRQEDRLFAYNSGLFFIHPRDLLFGSAEEASDRIVALATEPPPREVLPWPPRCLEAMGNAKGRETALREVIAAPAPCLVLLVGLQALGKSRFASAVKNEADDFVVISGDDYRCPSSLRCRCPSSGRDRPCRDEAKARLASRRDGAKGVRGSLQSLDRQSSARLALRGSRPCVSKDAFTKLCALYVNQGYRVIADATHCLAKHRTEITSQLTVPCRRIYCEFEGGFERSQYLASHRFQNGYELYIPSAAIRRTAKYFEPLNEYEVEGSLRLAVPFVWEGEVPRCRFAIE